MTILTPAIMFAVSVASNPVASPTSGTGRPQSPTYCKQAQSCRAEIRRRGASAVVTQLYEDGEAWASVLRRIARADPGWLAVAVRLRHGADAGPAEMLTSAVGEALAKFPEHVLDMAVPAFSIESVCGGPDVDDARFRSYASATAELERRIAALRRVQSPRLVQRRESCAHHLETARSGLREFFQVQ